MKKLILFFIMGIICLNLNSCSSGGDDSYNEEIADYDFDNDGYDSDSDCNDKDSSIHPGAAEIACDNTDQDCDGGDLCTTTEPISCIDDLNDWKISFEPHNSDCIDCHTTCVPDIRHTFCTEGEVWNRTESECLACHRSVHN